MTEATETQAAMSGANSQAPATRWMVGVDGSHDSAAALRWTVSMVEGTGAGVVPVCAWYVPLPIFALAGRRVADVDRMGLRATADVAASATIELVGATEVVGELLVIEGHPSDALLELTGPGQVVVVGRRGISEIRHRVLGSVSRDLATHAAGPVVIVPDTWEQRPCRSIVVGFDGSEHAQAALRWAIRTAPPSVTVSALMAIDVIPWLKPELVVERHPDYVESAEQRIRAAADAVDPDGRAERTVVLHGPRQALADVMSDADLVVLGPRGLGGVGRAVLGSVTTWMLHECPCPVAIVPS
jgi:nucleotide-binding universal stress UspA family protein